MQKSIDEWNDDFFNDIRLGLGPSRAYRRRHHVVRSYTHAIALETR